MSYIFISYSRTNNILVRGFVTDLQSNGVPVWVDHKELKAGTPDWDAALREAISKARAVVFMASVEARKSRYVRDELAIADMYDVPIFPVWIEGKHWHDCVPMGYGATQFVDLRGEAYGKNLAEIINPLKKLFTDGTEQPESALTLVRETETAAPARMLRNPYKGLLAFRKSDKDDFYGRESLIESMIGSLRMFPSFVALIGASGSGKSSVVMAGLLPRLENENILLGSQEWVYIDDFVPGKRPLRALAERLSKVLPNKSSFAVMDELEHPSGEGLASLVRQISTMPSQRVVIYIDQFEEIFTLTETEKERRQFITLLIEAIHDANCPVTVIITMRADFYDRPLNYPDLGELIDQHKVSILPLTLADLYDVILKPAEKAGLEFENGLVQELIFDVRDQIGALPLLQFTLDQLYIECVETQHLSMLTLQSYHALGGVKGALAKQAETTYQNLNSDQERNLARALFLRLIEPGSSEQDTSRRRATLKELQLTNPADTLMLADVANEFVKARLLTADKSEDSETIEVSHEALIREWERLGDWLHDSRSDIFFQKKLGNDAEIWAKRRRNEHDDILYRGSELEDALSWVKQNIPSELEAAFIQASDKEQTRRRTEELAVARRVKRAEQVRNVLISVSIVALLSIIVAIATARQAQTERDTALNEQETAVARVANSEGTLTPIPITLTAAIEPIVTARAEGTRIALDNLNAQSRRLSELSRTQLNAGYPENALILGLKSLDYYPTVTNADSFKALNEALNYPVSEKSNFYNPSGISSAELSDDGQRFLISAADRSLQLWKVGDTQPAATLQLDRAPTNFLLDEAHNRALACTQGSFYVWSLNTLESHVLRFNAPSSLDTGCVASPDLSTVVIYANTLNPFSQTINNAPANSPYSFYVWKLDDPAPMQWFSSYPVDDVDWAADNDHFISHSNIVASETQLWSVSSNQPPVYLGVSFKALLSPGGDKVILLAGSSVIIRNVDGDEEPLNWSHSDTVNGALWSSDGQRVLSWGKDGKAYIWSAVDGSARPISLDHNDNVTGALWSQDNRRVLTWSDDKTAKLWSLASDPPSAVTLPITDSFSDSIQDIRWREGLNQIITITNSTVAVWDDRTYTAISLPIDSSVSKVVSSPDGQYILLLNNNGIAYLYAVRGDLLAAMRHNDRVSGIQWSSNPSDFMTWGTDGVKFWEVNASHDLPQDEAGLIGAAEEKVNRDLNNQELERYALPTLIPTATLARITPTPLPSLTPTQPLPTLTAVPTVTSAALTAAEYERLGLDALNKADFDLALTNLRLAFEMEPSNLGYLNTLNLLRNSFFDFEEVLASGEQFLETGEGDANFYRTLGGAALGLKNYDLALQYADLALEKTPPQYFEANLLKGFIFTATKQPLKAREVLDTATQYYPTLGRNAFEVTIQIFKGISYLYEGDYDNALTNFNIVINSKLSPGDGEIWKAVTTILQGDRSQLEVLFNQVVANARQGQKVNFNLPLGYAYEAIVELLRGNTDRAITLFQLGFDTQYGKLYDFWITVSIYVDALTNIFPEDTGLQQAEVWLEGKFAELRAEKH